MNSRPFLYLLLLLPIAFSTGCARPRMPTVGDMPFVHKIDVQQGNVVTQEMLAQLQRGMDKKKVLFIMGTPVIQDTFHAERWDYLYLYHRGGGGTERRHVTLVFADDLLDRVEGDVTPAPGTLVVDTRQDMTVAVPYEYEKSLLGKLADNIPFTGGDGKKPAAAGAAGDEQGSAGDLEEAEEEVIVPTHTVKKKKKKGFFRRMLDKIGGAQEKAEKDKKSDDRRYGDPSDASDW